MRLTLRRLSARLAEVNSRIARRVAPITGWRLLPEAETTRQIPADDDPRWQPFAIGDWWGADENLTHAWFACEVARRMGRRSSPAAAPG
ncbi:MAG: hypothetical protein GXY52_02535 [Chloroflexi bacterium]|nr:hypothetical protein [Chloroflexota bacterium]